jgi:hypothetical protein
MVTNGPDILLATRTCPGDGVDVGASVANPLLPPVVVVLVAVVAPVLASVRFGVVVPVAAVPINGPAAAVTAKPPPANVIAAIIAQSCFLRVCMDSLLSLAAMGSSGPNEFLGLQNDLSGCRVSRISLPFLPRR